MLIIRGRTKYQRYKEQWALAGKREPCWLVSDIGDVVKVLDGNGQLVLSCQFIGVPKFNQISKSDGGIFSIHLPFDNKEGKLYYECDELTQITYGNIACHIDPEKSLEWLEPENRNGLLIFSLDELSVFQQFLRRSIEIESQLPELFKVLILKFHIGKGIEKFFGEFLMGWMDS